LTSRIQESEVRSQKESYVGTRFMNLRAFKSHQHKPVGRGPAADGCASPIYHLLITVTRSQNAFILTPDF
jgi:hypothetical protein